MYLEGEKGGSAGSPRRNGEESGGSRDQVRHDGSGVGHVEDENFRVLKGGDISAQGARVIEHPLA